MFSPMGRIAILSVSVFYERLFPRDQRIFRLGHSDTLRRLVLQITIISDLPSR